MPANRVTFRRNGIVEVDGKPHGTWKHDITWSAIVDFIRFAPRRTKAELVEAIIVTLESEEF